MWRDTFRESNTFSTRADARDSGEAIRFLWPAPAAIGLADRPTPDFVHAVRLTASERAMTVSHRRERVSYVPTLASSPGFRL